MCQGFGFGCKAALCPNFCDEETILPKFVPGVYLIIDFFIQVQVFNNLFLYLIACDMARVSTKHPVVMNRIVNNNLNLFKILNVKRPTSSSIISFNS